MKTMNSINTMIQEDRETYKETSKALYNAVQMLDGIYTDTIGGKPSETVAAFAGAVGLDMAETVIASLVNRSAWDGRISRNSALWAENVPESWDKDAAKHIGMFSTIHAAHLDQLAQAMQTYAAETRKAQRVAERDAHEEKARQEAAQSEHAEKLNRDAQTIEAASQALRNGGIIRACTVCTIEDGQEREENIFVHLARIYGVYLPARTKGVIYRRFSGVDIAKDGLKVRVNKRDKVTHGVLDFLFALVGAARSAAAFLGDGTKQDSTDGAETENTPQAIKNTMPEEKPVQATENRPDLQYAAYLREAIAGWYKNANEDYGVNGAFLRTEVEGQDLYITWTETQDSAPGMKEQTIYSLMVSWYQDYTPEQVYNIWMEGDGAEIQAQRQFNADTGDTVPEPPADTDTPEDGSLNASPDEAIRKYGAGASVQAIRQKLHDAKIQLRRYACFASVSPGNALHIHEQITRLQDEIQNLEDGVAELTDTS